MGYKGPLTQLQGTDTQLPSNVPLSLGKQLNGQIYSHNVAFYHIVTKTTPATVASSNE